MLSLNVLNGSAPHAAVAPPPQPCHGRRTRSGEPGAGPVRTGRAALEGALPRALWHKSV